MTENGLGPITEFGAAIEQFAGAQARETVMAGSERILDAPPEESAMWLKGAVDRLDATVDEGTRVQIMEQMGVNCAEMTKSHVERALARRPLRHLGGVPGR